MTTLKSRNYKVAIDGPSASGKSTIAKLLAKKLNFLYIDSGAMYRAVTLYTIKKKLLNKPENKLRKYIKTLKITFLNKKNNQAIFLNNKNVTSQIRTSPVNKLVSEISSRKFVRAEMVKRQKEFAKRNPIVMDGRDIGTTVFKDADLKIYLTASPLVRAKRRKKDLQKLGENVRLKDLIKQIQERDDYDSSRTISPLGKANDAIVIDSTNLSVDKVINQISTFLPS